jgi:hypothetical protein
MFEKRSLTVSIENKIFSYDEWLAEQLSTSEYDSILDVYNKRKDKMTDSEKNFFNSGGKIGKSFTYNLPDDMNDALDELIMYLDDNSVQWNIIESYFPGFGHFNYLEIDVDSYPEDQSKRILSVAKQLFSVIPNPSPYTLVDNRQELIRGGRAITVLLVDPDRYADHAHIKYTRDEDGDESTSV